MGQSAALTILSTLAITSLAMLAKNYLYIEPKLNSFLFSNGNEVPRCRRCEWRP